MKRSWTVLVILLAAPALEAGPWSAGRGHYYAKLSAQRLVSTTLAAPDGTRFDIPRFLKEDAGIFVAYGKPVKVLILAGALNGLILPVTLATILVAAHKKSIVGDYRHPRWMAICGAIVVIAMFCMGAYTLVEELPKFFR